MSYDDALRSCLRDRRANVEAFRLSRKANMVVRLTEGMKFRDRCQGFDSIDISDIWGVFPAGWIVPRLNCLNIEL